MRALGPPLFPNFRYESYNVVGENHNMGTYGVVHHHTSLGVTGSSNGNGINNNSVVIKKLNHNANERNRRKETNSLFSSLRSCLPRRAELKKLSIPQTVSLSLQYIQELQEQMKKLVQKKEDLLARVSGQRERYGKPQAKVVASYVSTVFTTKLRDNEVMAQISSSKIHVCSIYNVLSALEEDGFALVDVSSSSSRGERLFYTLHLQVDKIDSYNLVCKELSQRISYLYEGCGNSFK